MSTTNTPRAIELANKLDDMWPDPIKYLEACEISDELRRLAAVDVERDALRAELERIKALQPVAWANPYGGFLSDEYVKDFASGLEKEKHTIPLYALAQPKEQT